MTITSKFYTGAVNNVQWAAGLMAATNQYVVVDDGVTSGGFKVTINGGVTRGFTVAAGTAAGGGIVDENDAPLTGASFAVPLNVSNRWWLIGLRRVWGATKATTVDWISAGSTKVIPTRPMVPGVEDFQPLALAFVPASGGAITEMVDLRSVGAVSGRMTVFDVLTKDFLNRIGTNLLHVRTVALGGSFTYERTVDTAGVPVWVDRPFNKIACRVGRSGGQSISNNTATTVEWTTTTYDYGDMHDPTTNAGRRVVFPVAGIYLIEAGFQFATGSDYNRVESLIRKNGVTTLAHRRQQGTSLGTGQLFGVATTAEFAVNDYIEVRVEQGNTAAASRLLEASGLDYAPYVTATLLFPS